jgi:tetratricopeptide (TPR) repeat protein
LVHEGWRHLQLERPLAAWASWRRALQHAPDDPAGTAALERLARSADLPHAARAVYRFQAPSDEARRARWDARLRGGGLDDLAVAAEAFDALSINDPGDWAATLNRGLCLAWLGRNAEAIGCLDRVVTLLAEYNAERAIEAWTIAEVLRLGAGAENLADDLRHVWSVHWPGSPPSGLLEHWPNLLRMELPDLLTGNQPAGDTQVFEWLDRPSNEARQGPAHADEVPRVLATVFFSQRGFRLSTPDPTGLAALDDPAYSSIARVLEAAEHETTPLPIAWADAALGTFKVPSELDEQTRGDLTRDVVEHFYENLWINQPRHALDGLSPAEAARASAGGNAIAACKLAAVVRFREQLGSRSTRVSACQGYPFDRLRRRLAMLPADSAAFDPEDVSCMSEPELDRLDPDSLDDARLADAFRSVSAFRDDARTVRFASVLARRDPPSLGRLDPAAVFAPLIRRSLAAGDPGAALAWLDRARSISDDPHRRTFSIWSAEVLARTGRPDDALRAYQDLLASSPGDAALALDGAETLLDNSYPEHARPLLLEARNRAIAAGDQQIHARADALIAGDR